MTDTRQYGRADVDYATWYSDWSRRLAKLHTRAELERDLAASTYEGERAARAHLRARAQPGSMRLAMASNVSGGHGEHCMALTGALEIHDLFPEHAKPTG